MSKVTNLTETITAIATPSGSGGVGIVRIAGPLALDIASQITEKTLTPRAATFSQFYTQDHSILDEGIAVYFKAPHSFTGDDVIELQGHGGVVVMDRLLRRVLECGARMAKPGEFSERAFLNDKIDLTQAEAIADLIASKTEQAAIAAARTLTGVFSKAIAELQEKLTRFRMYVEAAIDFPEEEIDFLADEKLFTHLNEILSIFVDLTKKTKQGVLLQEGLQAVILGRPNAGKSTLLNYLAGRDIAIVTDIPGTTRDVMRETIQLNGVPLQIVDTAGLRETECPIEQEGISRAWREYDVADIILLLADCRELSILAPLIADIQENKIKKPMYILANKIDLMNAHDYPNQFAGITVLPISAKTGTGMTEFANALLGTNEREKTEGEFLARRRHLHALEQAETAMQNAMTHLQTRQGELLAEDCRQAQRFLSDITGKFSADDLIGEIFSQFCIGK